jgi:lysozyme family protein
MRANFDKALSAVLVHEGGYVNHPKDPGGATNKGVTQAVYDDWRVAHKLPAQTVKDITTAEVMAIYKHRYWDAINGDELPDGVDYAVFDFAVNSGVYRAARYLQEAVGVAADGQIGPVTLAAIRAKPAQDLVTAICDARMAFLKRLTTFDTFGRGWTRRVEDVRCKGRSMAA